MNLAGIFLKAFLIDNIVLMQFIALCSYLGMSSDVKQSFGMSAAVAFVTVLAAAVCWPLYHYALSPLGITFMQILVFILVIASLVQLVEFYLKKNVPALYSAMGIYLPLITTNCAVLGVCLINIQEEYNFFQMLISSFAYPVGFGLALVLFAGVRERILLARTPKPFQDTAIGLVTAGMLSLTFFAFKGWV